MDSSQEHEMRATRLEFDKDMMDVYLEDGRMLRIPLEWYPRLERATMAQRKTFRWIWNGEAIEWPDIDEHLSVASFLRGEKAPRSQPYLTGVWPKKLQAERERIEKADRAKKGMRRVKATRIAA